MNFSQGPAFEGLFRPNASIMTELTLDFRRHWVLETSSCGPLATELTASVKGLAEHCAV
jgi:hypothetical protein